MFECVGLGDFGIFFLKGLLGNGGGNQNIKWFLQIGKMTEYFEIFFRSEVMGLISIGNEVGDEDFLCLGDCQSLLNTHREEVADN